MVRTTIRRYPYEATCCLKRILSIFISHLSSIFSIEILKQHVKAGTSPLCGNSIHQDRRFLVKYMPELEDFFHYRNIDVSTLKELAKRWNPAVVSSFTKTGTHQALDDIRESINELKHYRQHFLISQ